ncbi:MAG: hypothetical protein JWQ57_964 [Mucilaginibacter sp.]|nr:hypothetical protein [Mucilaginibacter sp.]
MLFKYFNRLFLLTILFFFSTIVLAQGIHFEQGLTWQQVMEKANKEHKYIFVDCYATWCAPCKLMDRQVYADTLVGSIMNRLFISVKVQMDSTKSDDAFNRSWYADRRKLERDYHIDAYPTFLFFSPRKQFVHKMIGFLDSLSFLRTAMDATDVNSQVYILLEKFRKQQLSDSQIPKLLTLLEKADDKRSANEVATAYINNYLLRLPDELLLKKENLVILGKYLKSSHDPAFNVFYKRKREVDQIMHQEYAETKVGDIILKETVLPMLWRDSSYKDPIVLKPAWQSIGYKIKEKYGDFYADYLIPFEQIAFYKKTKQWPELMDVYIKKIEKEGVGIDDAEDNTNNVLYYLFFKYGSNRKTLLEAANWAKIIVDDHPDEPDYVDTYANLLYKAGQKKEAIKWELEAVSLKRNQLQDRKKHLQKSEQNEAFLKEQIKEIEAMETVLMKMKMGKSTWNDN